MAALAQPSISTVADDSQEVRPLLQKKHAFKDQSSQKWNVRCPKYKMVKISEKGAIFMIIWNLLYTIALFSALVLGKNSAYAEYSVAASVTILYPVVGVIIDIWVGTFKMIKLSLYLLLVAIVLKCIYLFIFHLNIILYLSIVGWYLAGVGYLASIIPLTTTQLIGPSGEELSLTIYWLLWGLGMGQLLGRGLPCLVDLNEKEISVFLSILSVTSFILTYIMMENCSHVLMTKPKISNAIKQIAKVLNYARKHKIPEGRSAFTYWEEDYPPRIDLGKDKYGGPFTVEEVEDVKTVLRLIPVVVCISMFAVGITHVNYHYSDLENAHCFNQVDASSNIASCAIAAVSVPLYHFLVHPLLFRHIPGMLKRIGIGILLMVLSFFSYMILELATHLEKEEIICMFSMENTKLHFNFFWASIPFLLHALGRVLIIYCSIEFIIAQKPQQIKGLMMCVALETFSIFTIFGYAIEEVFLHFPFQAFPSCGFYYYMTFFIIAVINFLLFVAISKWYKLRKRDDIVPYHMFAENYFEKNQMLEQEYLQAMDSAFGRTSTINDSESDSVY